MTFAEGVNFTNQLMQSTNALQYSGSQRSKHGGPPKTNEHKSAAHQANFILSRHFYLG